MKRIKPQLLKTCLLVVALCIFGALFLYWIGVDVLEERSNFQFYADSVTYHKAARGELPGFEGLSESIAVSGNYLGPLLILDLAQQNYYAVLFLNGCMLFLAIASIARSLKLDPLRFATILLINPLTFSSVLSVNKEIISLVFVALLLRAFVSRSIGVLILAALISLMVRWQLFVFLVAACSLTSRLNPFRDRRAVTLAVVLVGLSILYVQLASVFEPIMIAFDESAAEYEGSGFYEWLQRLQQSGAYWAIFPLKAAHLLFGLGLRLDRLISPVDIYNDVWQLLHSTATLVLFGLLWRARRFRLANDLVYVSVIYVAIFGMSPIYSPRYFYVVYVLWAAALTALTATPNLLSATRTIRTTSLPGRNGTRPKRMTHDSTSAVAGQGQD